MIRFLILAIVAIATVLGSWWLKIKAPGEASLSYFGSEYTVALWQGLLLAAAFLALFYIATRILFGLIGMPKTMQKSMQAQRQRSAATNLASGMLELNQGNWDVAEKKFTSNIDDSASPFLNYMAAADAAQRQGKVDARDDYLQRALERKPDGEFAVDLKRAEYLLDDGDNSGAAELVDKLRGLQPNHNQVLNLATSAYERTERWEDMTQVLATGRQQFNFDGENQRRLEETAWSHVLSGEGADVKSLWSKVPDAIKDRAGVLAPMVGALAASGDEKQAQGLLGQALESGGWSDKVANLFGDLNIKDTPALESVVDRFKDQNVGDGLDLLKAKVALAHDDLDGAASMLQNAVKVGMPSAFKLLSDVLTKKGDSAGAIAILKKGLSLL